MNNSSLSNGFTVKDILAFTIVIYKLILPIILLFGIVTIMAGVLLFN